MEKKETRHAGVTVLNSHLSYRTVNDKATEQVSVLNNVSRGGKYSARYAYTYDDNGNITAVTVLYEDGTSHTTTYVYDSANQLIRENNQAAGKTWTWSYDAAGNLRSKREFAYNTGTLGDYDSIKGYAYGNDTWGDLLTTYNSQSIEYDKVGNMVSYANRTLTWKHGRQLASLTDKKDGVETTWAFLYDDSGMRVKRTNGTIAYTYVYDGGKLTYMTRGSQELSFTYDGDGNPMSVTFTNNEGTNTYYYVTNLQGDVTALLTPDGTCVVEYTYDAWGNILSRTGSLEGTLGVSNPLRYRGYVYDIETGLYYLQSRYYDPQLGRFISSDALVATGQGILGNNMFAYCTNNPVIYYDECGTYNVPLLHESTKKIRYLFLDTNDEGDIFITGMNGDGTAIYITNSDQINDLCMQYGYSIYLCYASEYSDYITGSPFGVMYEWGIHNAGAVATKAAGGFCRLTGMDDSYWNKLYTKFNTVDIGPTIFHDSYETHGAASTIMKIGYVSAALVMSPASLVTDVFQYCVDKWGK